MNASSQAAAMDPATAARTIFDPPPAGGKRRAFALALLAHLLLVLALAWGLRWKKDAQDMAVDAELWSAVAQTAAPQATHVPPPPPPPVARPQPKPTPVPEPKPTPQVQDDSAREAELALEQQKKREEQAKRQAEQQARLQAQRQEETERQAAAKKAKAAQQAAEAEAAKQAAAQQATAIKAAQQQAKTEQAKEDAARVQRTTHQLMALAGADLAGMTNTPVSGQGKTPGGTAKRDAGPSAGYAARLRARVKPNITYPDLSNISGNPRAEVEISASPDGTIIERHLTKSSGVPSWDAAVLRAIDKTQVLPPDVDGRVPSPIIFEFRPND